METEISYYELDQDAVLGGPLFPDGFCDSHPGSLRDCVHSPGCSIRGVWRSLNSLLRIALEGVSIEDLTRGDSLASERLRRDWERAREAGAREAGVREPGAVDACASRLAPRPVVALIRHRASQRGGAQGMTEQTEASRLVEERSEYKWGWVTDIESDVAPPGLSEDIVRFISAKKNEPEFMLEWRLRAFRTWVKMAKEDGEPRWAHVTFPPIDYQAISYYAAPRKKEGPKSIDEVDPELLRTFEKLGIPLNEQKLLAGVAVDAVFDSVSVATTFKDTLAKQGIIFCSFSEAIQKHPELVQKSRSMRVAVDSLL